MNTQPDAFINLQELSRSFIIDLKYATTDNFTGQIVPGYLNQKALLTLPAANALMSAQKELLKRDLAIKVYDAYRPVKAVKAFEMWAKSTSEDAELKKRFYPKYQRPELLELGFIALRSSHSRGSAIDVGLVNLKLNQELDMGSEFDFFDEISSNFHPLLSKEQRENRQILKESMELSGFKNYSAEWWHFSFRPEPYPETYFDFDII